MTLRADVPDFKFHIVRQLALNSEVVLRRILATHLRLECSKQRNWTKHGPVHRLATWWSQDSVDTGQRGEPERIRVRESTALIFKRGVKQSIEGECASSEGWFRAELFQHQLLDRVIE